MPERPMNEKRCTILVADDDKYIRDDLADLLKSDEVELLFAATARETWEKVSEARPDVVLLDIKFPDSNDLGLLEKIKTSFPQIAVIILTSQSENVPQIVSAIKLGAFDYVPKPFVGAELNNRIQKALALQKLARSQEHLLKELEERAGLDQLVGRSPAITRVVESIRKLAQVEGCVLIQGETGTGKELVARALHYLSSRRSNPFVPVNCGAIPEALIDSVLFGHRRGAFTGATESVKGKFETAEDGTIFLDEIGEMPLAQQTSLLRVLEYRHFTPIGETKERQCRARFILATHRDLRECVSAGTFREDLYFRINVAAITMPPLRNRSEDVPLLVEHYVKRLCAEMGRAPVSVMEEVIELFKQYDWPGNVRELKNVLEGSLMLSDPQQRQITLRDLPAELLASRTPESGKLSTDEADEKKQLLKALQQCNGNQTQAAKALGVHRNTIRAKIRYYGLSDTGLS
jgi:DNA-binding NtrC family response regulator